MAFCRLTFPLLVLSVVSASNVPVFLWGDLAKTSVKSNPLTTITGPEFRGVLERELKNDPYMVIFIEESLSVEDFSRKNVDGETSLPFLREHLGDSLYLPSVENVLNELYEFSDQADHVKLTENGLSSDVENENNKILFVTLKDAMKDESRYEMLRRHNDLMENEFTKLQEKYSNVIGIYTALNPSWIIPVTHSRFRRQANQTTDSSPDYSLDGLRLYVKEIRITTANTTTNVTGYVSSETELNNTVMSTTMNFENTNLTLNFRSAHGYWFFDTVTLKQMTPTVDEILYPTSNVEAILGFSYRCKQFVSFTSVNETVVFTVSFEDIKVQPFFEHTNETVVFGDSFNCVGFFSAPIWSALFVVFILLAITFYGIMMMMDIRTMDRFDDPKGKTITINAE